MTTSRRAPRFFTGRPTPRAPSLAGALALVLGAALALTACVEPDSDYYDDSYDDYGGPLPVDEIAELTIDAGEAVTLDPGAGVGVGVAYLGDGQWSLTTACDTNTSSAACIFDVLVISDESATGIVGLDGTDLESDDDLFMTDPFAAQLDFRTEDDTDGALFTTSPGATVRVSALLYDPIFDSAFDWDDDPRIISWVGSGGIHQGAPTNPVDLRPNRP